MKLIPLLSGILVREAHAQDACPPEKSIIEVTCHEDLTIQLAIDGTCLLQRYPDVKITDLIIGQDPDSPSTQCDACTDSDPSANCQSSDNFFAYDFQDPSPLPVPVTNASPSIWFKAGECGSSMDAVDDKAEFQTKIFKPVTNVNGIVSQRTILATDITCKYPDAIEGINMDPGANIQADGSSDVEKVDPNPEVDYIGTDQFKVVVLDETTGKTVMKDDPVAVGNRIKITVEADSAITEFFLAQCFATNKLDAPDKILGLIGENGVTAGCMNDLGESLQTAINAVSPNPGHYIGYNQFGFTDDAATEVELTFVLTCNILLKTAPTDDECAPLKAGRKRRETEEPIVQTVSSVYTLKLEENMLSDTIGDIVVAHKGQGKGDNDNDGQVGGNDDTLEHDSSHAVTNAIALMAIISAIILL